MQVLKLGGVKGVVKGAPRSARPGEQVPVDVAGLLVRVRLSQLRPAKQDDADAARAGTGAGKAKRRDRKRDAHLRVHTGEAADAAHADHRQPARAQPAPSRAFRTGAARRRRLPAYSEAARVADAPPSEPTDLPFG